MIKLFFYLMPSVFGAVLSLMASEPFTRDLLRNAVTFDLSRGLYMEWIAEEVDGNDFEQARLWYKPGKERVEIEVGRREQPPSRLLCVFDGSRSAIIEISSRSMVIANGYLVPRMHTPPLLWGLAAVAAPHDVVNPTGALSLILLERLLSSQEALSESITSSKQDDLITIHRAQAFAGNGILTVESAWSHLRGTIALKRVVSVGADIQENNSFAIDKHAMHGKEFNFPCPLVATQTISLPYANASSTWKITVSACRALTGGEFEEDERFVIDAGLVDTVREVVVQGPVSP